MPLSRVTGKGASWVLTATVTVTSADDGCGGRVVRGVGLAEDGAEGVDGLALEAEAYVGVDAGGDADVGVAEEFLDDDEIDALFQEEGGGRVSEVVKADRPEVLARRSRVQVGSIRSGAEPQPPVACEGPGWPALRRVRCASVHAHRVDSTRHRP